MPAPSTDMHFRLTPPFALSPMAGLTDSAFRRLVKRQGGCGLVVTEMVSAEGLVRGSIRTREHAWFTEEERPVAVQIFGADPGRMARAAQIVEQAGADVVDVNMGCPVPKVARHQAGCSLMREPDHAAMIVKAMVGAVTIPVTVKMRAGWDGRDVNAPELARQLADAGAAALAVHGRTAEQSYRGNADWDLIARVARAVSIPVFGNGDCVEPHELLVRMRDTGVAGVFVGRGVLRNPWIFAQAAALAAGLAPPDVTLADRGRFLLDYIDLLLADDDGGPTAATGDRQRELSGLATPWGRPPASSPAARRDRSVVNKLRALAAWYTRGLENGAHFRVTVNHTESLAGLRQAIREFFLGPRISQARQS